jgi:hypothetical protein
MVTALDPKQIVLNDELLLGVLRKVSLSIDRTATAQRII